MKECRYCLQGGGDMISPCHCKGHLEWVHVRCWTQWQTHKNNTYCEICHSKYSFSIKLILQYVCRLICYLTSYYYTFRYRLNNDGILNAGMSHFIIYLASRLIFTLPEHGENTLLYNVFAWHCMYICIDMIYFRRFHHCSVHAFVMFIYYAITKNRTIKDILF